jgi:hypothetical protein
MRTKSPEIGNGKTCHSRGEKMAHTENTLSSSLPPFIDLFSRYNSQNWWGACCHQILSHTLTHTSIKNKPSSTYSHPQHHLSIATITMPLEHVVTHEAFHEITYFICDNGNNWGEFCHSTSCPLTTRKTVKTPPLSN